MPVVTAGRARVHAHARAVRIARGGVVHRAPGLEVHALGPVHRHVLLGGEQLAVRRIEHIEEAVLRRLHHDVALRAVDRQVRRHDRLHGGVVPAVAGRGLVVPRVFAGVGLQRDDRRQEQVVALAAAARLMAPRRPVARADVDEVGDRVVDDRIPRRAAAAGLLPAAVVPRRRGLLGEDLVGRRAVGLAFRIRRHEEAPRELARGRVVGGDEAAHAELGAAVADEHLAFDDARRAGDRVRPLGVRRLRRPQFLAGGRIEGDEAAVERADEHLALVDRDAAVHDVAARVLAFLAVDLRVVVPLDRARARIERVDVRPARARVEHAVHHQRRRFHAAVGLELRVPREPEGADVRPVDLLQRAVALFGIAAADADPFVVGLGRDQPRVIDDGGGRRRRGRGRCCRLAGAARQGGRDGGGGQRGTEKGGSESDERAHESPRCSGARRQAGSMRKRAEF